MALAPLRPIEAIQIEHKGQPMILVRDPEGLCDQQIVLPLPVFMIATMLDGQRDARDVQQELMRASGGQLIPTEMIEKMIAELDQFYLFENERAAGRRGEMEAAYDEMEFRPAVHAGSAYPEDAPTFTQVFDQFFEGLDHGAAPLGPRPRGLILPHIDLRVGGKTIAQGIARLRAERPASLYVILGVAHQPARNLFVMTDKDFATPLGAVETDKQAARRLEATYGRERLAGGLAHLAEHSIEFPVVALRYFHREAPEFKILPILCGMLHDEVMQDPPAVSALILPNGVRPSAPSPAERPDVGEFIGALKQLIADHDGDVVVIASVDLSHVGLKFGDEKGVTPDRMASIRRADEEMLEHVEKMDAEGFFNHFRRDRNARNVDAVTAVYILLKVLEETGKAEKIAYEQWHEEPTESMVSYASMAIY